MKTTNVLPGELNYDSYTSNKYDADIVNSIPFHRELHEQIVSYIREKFSKHEQLSILDLGVGTGITSRILQSELPNAEFDVVDFSEQMLAGARQKLGDGVRYICTDYSILDPGKKYEMIASVIGMHHQNESGKKLMFKKVYNWLKPGGVFVFGDLMTYANKHDAALNQAYHFHHLVEKTSDQQTLKEWAYHHLALNDLATIEDQLAWLKTEGFKVQKLMHRFNTALLVCLKGD